jgi:hypothetical protein
VHPDAQSLQDRNKIDMQLPDHTAVEADALAAIAEPHGLGPSHPERGKREKYRLGLHNGDDPFGYARGGASTKEPLTVVGSGGGRGARSLPRPRGRRRTD